MKIPHKPVDVKGNALYKGDRVRIIGVPALQEIDVNDELKTHAVFRHLQGTVKRIRGFDQFGHAEIFFSINTGDLAGWHGVCIEPHFLLRQKSGHKA